MKPERPNFIGGYSTEFQRKAAHAKNAGTLLPILQKRCPDANQVQNNAQLYTYVQDYKRQYLKSSPPLGKVRYNDKISTLNRALGLHTYAVRVQGNKLKRKNELRVASVFKDLPRAFLTMIVVHELAHLRHKDHNKAFYRLCEHMEPDYHRYEADLRLWLFAIQKPPPSP